jgi:PAS domain S-box-containing protein
MTEGRPTDDARILVIDDEQLMLRATSRLLARAGYQVAEATTGKDGVRTAMETKPDLILLDIMLPDIDGLEVCRRIKSGTDLTDSVVVLLSGKRIDSEEQAAGLEQGADDYIVRPIPNRELLARIEAMLRLKRADEALRESEARLELAVAGSNGGMWHLAFDPDDPYHSLPDEIYLSPSLKALIGYSDAEFPNSLAAWENQVLARDLPRLRDSSRQYREGRIDRHQVEYRIRHKDGSIRWLRTSGRVERDETGRPVRFAGIDWDITARKQAEEALRYQATLLRSVSDAVITTDLDFVIQSWNTAAQALYGWPADEVIGKLMGEVVPTTYPSDEQEAVLAQFQADGVWQGEAIQRHKDGSDLHVLASVKLVRDDAGRPVSVLAVNRDITERQQVEEALQRERDLVDRVMDTSPVGIAVFDRQGQITFVNNRLQQLASLVGETTLVGRAFNDPAWQSIGPDDEPVSEEESPYALVMSSGRPVYNVEHGIESDEGQRLYLSSNAAPLFDESGEINSVVVTTEDITQRKRAEAQLEEAAAKAERERLARDLHDAVTQSLFSVAAIAEAMPRVWERDPEEARRGLEELRWLTQGALAEMRAMLLELRPATLLEHKLGVLLRQLTDAMMGRTRMPVTTTVVGDCELPADVQIALYRIAQEALNNVTKHARASQAKVSLHNEPGRVRLRISDNGTGFDPGTVSVDHLGLNIMRERAEAIGATLRIESQPSHGTRIEVEWRGT